MAFAKGEGGRPKGAKNRPSPRVSAAMHIYEDTIGSLKHGGYYVYAHYDNHDCFYIGMGSGSRAWVKAPGCRNPQWWDRILAMMEGGDDYEVRIIAAGLTQDEALAIERELIRIRKPSCNIVYANMALTV